MKKIIISLCCLVAVLFASAQSPTFQWAKSMGGGGISTGVYGQAIVLDTLGNIYTTGYFNGTADFDPGAGAFNLTSTGGDDIFISKLDASGNFVWAKKMGGISPDHGQSIVVDDSGNVYTTGYFNGTGDFDPNSGITNLTTVGGSENIFISKLDASGNFVWAKNIGGFLPSRGQSIGLDSMSNVYVTGYFNGVVDFDPGVGTFNLTSIGSSDIFISKLDASGNFLWAKNIGGTANDKAYSITIDHFGNVYTTGSFNGTPDFDPGVGTFYLGSAGYDDVFISKLDSSGNFVWAKKIGGASYDYAYSITIDPLGNIYTTGAFYGTADFDPGAGITNLSSNGNYNIFISKLDASGNFVWAKNMGGGTSGVGGYSINVDISGNVYTTGYFWNSTDFDPGTGVFNLTSLGNTDIFISKLDSSGNFLWAKSMGANQADYGYSIVINKLGNVFTTGYFGGVVDSDPGAGIYNLTSTGSYDMFISSLDSAGNFMWGKNIGGGAYNDVGQTVTIDASGNIYTIGYFGGATADFDPGAGTFNLTSAGCYDIFISKLDPSGNFLWAKNMGGRSLDYGYSIAIDASGNIYSTGSFNETADFDPNGGTFNLTSNGKEDIFISKLDASGNFIWAKKIGGNFDDRGNSITTDASGNVYTTGYYNGTVDFDPNGGIANLTSVTSQDVFISKLDASGNFVWAKSIGGSAEGNSIAIDASGNIYTSGFFSGTADFDPGIGAFNLTSTGYQDIFVSKLNPSGDFLWAKKMGGQGAQGKSIAIDAFGNAYTTGYFIGTADFDPGAGIANLTATNIGGSDTVDIFISKLDSSGNFVWAKKMGGQSFDYGYSIALDASGNIYTTGSFIGTADFDPGAGIFNLTSVGVSDIFISKLDASGNFLWAKNMGGTTPDQGNSIAVGSSGDVYTTGFFGATANFNTDGGSFNLTSDGVKDIFIHKLSQTAVGLKDSININNITIYPNPNQGLFNISVSIPTKKVSIEIYNGIGTLVYKQTTLTQQQTIDLTGQANGLYFVKVMSDNDIVASQKIVKQ